MSELRFFEPKFETMTKDQVRAWQWQEFTRQVKWAYETSFYRSRFEAAGFSPDQLRRPEDVVRIPLTRKEELCRDVEANPPYGSRLRVSPSQLVTVVETSGTSGKGKEVHVATATDRERIIRMEACGFRWAGVMLGSVVAFTLPIGMGAAGPWWFIALEHLQANCLRLGNLDTYEKLRYMVRFGAEVLVATPAYVTRMERVAQEMGLDLRRDLPTMRSIIVAGEAKTSEWAQRRKEIWGATVYEQWGCSAGAVAWGCERGMEVDGELQILHNLPYLTYLEVIDPETGRHVADGEYGEIVVTTLGVEGAPVVRFATGDRARFLTSEHCPCGRPFDGIQAGTVSRYDDMMKVRGVNLWPSAVAAILDRFPMIGEHRGTVYEDEASRERIVLEVDFKADVPIETRNAVLRKLPEQLREAVGLNFEVVAWEGPRPLSAEIMAVQSGKAKRWRDLRGQSIFGKEQKTRP